MTDVQNGVVYLSDDDMELDEPMGEKTGFQPSFDGTKRQRLDRLDTLNSTWSSRNALKDGTSSRYANSVGLSASEPQNFASSVSSLGGRSFSSNNTVKLSQFPVIDLSSDSISTLQTVQSSSANLAANGQFPQPIANGSRDSLFLAEDEGSSHVASPSQRPPTVSLSNTPIPYYPEKANERTNTPSDVEIITIDSDSDDNIDTYVDSVEHQGSEDITYDPEAEAEDLRLAEEEIYPPPLQNVPPRQNYQALVPVQNLLSNNQSRLPASTDPGSDSDDEIVVLDVKDVSKTSFKPSSFDLLAPNGQVTNTVDNFNRPAPVHHSGGSTSNQNNELIISQLQARQQQYMNEHREVMGVISESNKSARFLQQLVENLRNKIQEATQTIQLLIAQGLDKEQTQKLQEKINNYRGDMLRASQRMNEKLLNSAAFKERLHRVAMGMQQTASAIHHFQLKLGNPFNTIVYDNTPFPEVQQPEAVSAPRGYSSNIYSQDNEDLQNLLDNIKSDEDLEEGLELTPPEMSINLMKHQRMGLTWLKRMEDSKSKGGILADDMGLGKTIQTIALMVANASDDEDCKTTLIVAPVSLLRQWAAEIESKLRADCALQIGIYHGMEKKFLTTVNKQKKFDVVLTSYGTLSSEWKRHYHEELEKAKEDKMLSSFVPKPGMGGKSYTSPFYAKEANFYRVILDEAQNIKNKNSISSRAVSSLKATYRFCLSGTPIQNNVDELYPIIRFLAIRPYNQEYKFRADISLPLKSRSGNYDGKDRDQGVRKLRAILKAILLRRSKTSLIDGKPILTLPEKHLISDYVKMEEEEEKFYKSLETGIQLKAKSLMQSNKKARASSILTLLLRLRQACIHKYLVEIGEMKSDDDNKGTYSYKPHDYARLYKKIEAIDPSVVLRVQHLAGIQDPEVKPLLIEGVTEVLLKDEEEEEIEGNEEGTFTCPLCLELISIADPVSVLSKCGHMICQGCIDSFFEDYTVDEDSNGTKIAECTECKVQVRPADLINYKLFQQVHEQGRSIDDFLVFCRNFYGERKQSDNKNLIEQLVARDKGFSVSVKISKCIELLENIFEKHPGEKIIVFSQFTTSFDLMKLVLDKKQISFLRYDGSMTVDQKNATIKSFYQTDCKLLLLSLRAGNVGLTLTCASHVVIMDPFWNPYVEEQAMDRAYRIGQEREVFVHRILIEGTVESRIMELQNMKKELVGVALDEKGMKSVSKLGQRELGFLFGLNKLV